MLICGTVQEANNGSDHAASSECNRDEKHPIRKARIRKPTFTPVKAIADLGFQRSCDVAARWTTREWVCPAETVRFADLHFGLQTSCTPPVVRP